MNGLKKLILGISLFMIAIILFIPLSVWGIIEILFNLFWKRKFWNSLGILGEFIILLAVIVDVTGNIVMQAPFNRILIKNNGYKFGSRYDTISFVLGVNKLDGTLSKTGLNLCKFLHKFDENHCINSANNKN